MDNIWEVCSFLGLFSDSRFLLLSSIIAWVTIMWGHSRAMTKCLHPCILSSLSLNCTTIVLLQRFIYRWTTNCTFWCAFLRFNRSLSSFCWLFPLLLITGLFNLLIRVILPCCSLGCCKIKVGYFFLDLFAQTYGELVTATNFCYCFTLEVEEWERMDSWFIISDTNFSIPIRSPSPS